MAVFLTQMRANICEHTTKIASLSSILFNMFLSLDKKLAVI
jgi:hypothetical protein